MVLFILGFFSLGATASSEASFSYQGTDKGRPCFLYIHREGEKGENYEVEVSTSYEHEGQGLGKVVLKFDPKSQGKILEWQDASTKEFLRVVLKKPSQFLSEPFAFRLNWMHFDHLHDATCNELRPVRAE